MRVCHERCNIQAKKGHMAAHIHILLEHTPHTPLFILDRQCDIHCDTHLSNHLSSTATTRLTQSYVRGTCPTVICPWLLGTLPHSLLPSLFLSHTHRDTHTKFTDAQHATSFKWRHIQRPAKIWQSSRLTSFTLDHTPDLWNTFGAAGPP